MVGRIPRGGDENDECFGEKRTGRNDQESTVDITGGDGDQCGKQHFHEFIARLLWCVDHREVDKMR